MPNKETGESGANGYNQAMQEDLATTCLDHWQTLLLETLDANQQDCASVIKCSRMHLRVVERQGWITSSRTLHQTFGAPVFNTA